MPSPIWYQEGFESEDEFETYLRLNPSYDPYRFYDNNGNYLYVEDDLDDFINDPEPETQSEQQEATPVTMPYYYNPTSHPVTIVNNGMYYTINPLGQAFFDSGAETVVPTGIPQSPFPWTNQNATPVPMNPQPVTVTGQSQVHTGNTIQAGTWGGPGVTLAQVFQAAQAPQDTPQPPSIPPPAKWSVKPREPIMDKNDPFYNKKLSRIIGFRSGKVQGDVGLEIEAEGSNLFRTPFKFWSCHEDGSLRGAGSHTPAEYVFRAPLKQKDCREALQYLREKLQESGSKIVKSTRTSVHVHVNCQMMTLRELFCFLGLWMIFEQPLVEWSGPNRVGNLFCLRASDSDFYVQMLESVLKTGKFTQWKDDYRYAACNVASIPKFGSLEFRSMDGDPDTHGNINIERILLWIDLLLMLRDVSRSFDNPIEIVQEFQNLGPLPFFKRIFKDGRFAETIQGTQNLSSKLWDGLRLFRDIAHSCEWKPPIKKNEPEVEEEVSNKKKYYSDQFIKLNERFYRVRHQVAGQYHVVDNLIDPIGTRRIVEIPFNHTLYYASGDSLGIAGYWYFLDLREGPPEFIDDQPDAVESVGVNGAITA